MNGPANMPTQYAMSTIAFTVTFFVCPAVTFVCHDSARTKPVTLIPYRHGQRTVMRVNEQPTSLPLPEQQADLVLP